MGTVSSLLLLVPCPLSGPEASVPIVRVYLLEAIEQVSHGSAKPWTENVRSPNTTQIPEWGNREGGRAAFVRTQEMRRYELFGISL